MGKQARRKRERQEARRYLTKAFTPPPASYDELWCRVRADPVLLEIFTLAHQDDPSDCLIAGVVNNDPPETVAERMGLSVTYLDRGIQRHFRTTVLPGLR